MKRAWPWAGAGIGVLALAGWLATGGLPLPVHSPSSTEPVASEPGARVGASPTPLPAERMEQALQFQTLLLPDGDTGADPASVRIGLAMVPPEDAAAYQDWMLGGGEGAGPSSLEELASVQRWLPVPAQRLDDGSVRVGPVPLPDADRYDLQASATDALHFYVAAFAPDDAPDSIAPVVAAGLRVHRDPAADSKAAVLLRRVESAPAAESWQHLMQREAPELLAAFDEDAVPVAPVQVLAPLPPGRIDVVLRVDGVDAQTLPVTLVAGRVIDVRFDPVAEAVARAVSMDLELEFVERGSGEPIEGLEVTWSGPRGEQVRTSDAAGSVRFEGLDRVRTHRFTLHATAPADGLPQWPELQPLEVSFDEDTGTDPQSRLQRRRIELTRLEWIVARNVRQDAPSAQRRSPYPIHVLQRERDGAWVDTAADFFLPVADGLAVSVAEPGAFRVATVLSPWRILHSTATDSRLPAADGRYRVDLIDSPGHRTEVTVLHDGVALANAPVRLRGPTRGLPPELLTTDAEGRLQLEGVTVPTVWIEVADGPEQAIDVQGAGTTVDVAIE